MVNSSSLNSLCGLCCNVAYVDLLDAWYRHVIKECVIYVSTATQFTLVSIMTCRCVDVTRKYCKWWHIDQVVDEEMNRSWWWGIELNLRRAQTYCEGNWFEIGSRDGRKAYEEGNRTMTILRQLSVCSSCRWWSEIKHYCTGGLSRPSLW